MAVDEVTLCQEYFRGPEIREVTQSGYPLPLVLI